MHAVLDDVAWRISRELDGLGAETAQLHPCGNVYRWSIQQVIEHLVLTCRVTTKRLETRLNKGRITGNQKRSGVQWTLQLMLLSFGYFPQGAPVLDETVPPPGLFPAMNGGDLGDLLRKELDAMDAVLDRCRHKFGMERVATHPILGPLRVDQWRRFHVVYGGHQLKQLQQLRLQFAPHAPMGQGTNRVLAKEMQIPAQRSLT